jgi:hypothetical protein
MPYFRDKWAHAGERLLIVGMTATTFHGWASCLVPAFSGAD